MCKKYFKGRNGMKEERHYDRYVMGDYIKACIVNVPPEMRYQLEKFLTRKLMIKDILWRRSIIQNDHYQ